MIHIIVDKWIKSKFEIKPIEYGFLYKSKYSFLDPPILSIVIQQADFELAEGNEVRMECQVKANPAVTTLSWLKDVSYFEFLYSFSPSLLMF